MRIAILLMLAGVCAATALAQTGDGQSSVTVDEQQWVVFYDLPSRRFREARNHFVRGRLDLVASELMTSAGYLEIEAGRAQPAIAERLNEVTARLRWIAAHVDDAGVTGTELDSQFGRAHWLLAQHYLEHARRSRDNQAFRTAGLYLWATTHHLERAVLWSNAPIDKNLHKTLESLRDLAARLQDEKTARKAIGEKPIVKAEALLRDLGPVINRPVVLTAG